MSNDVDTGQRYEIRATGYPREDQTVIGWNDTLRGAMKLMRAVLTAPGCISACVVDRTDGMILILVNRFGHGR